MKNCGLLRRFGAILYDTILVIALLLFASVPFVIFRAGEAVEPYTIGHQVTLLLVVLAFFIGFWSRSGSTLGMLAWGLRVETPDGNTPSLTAASIRCAAAVLSWIPLGLGFFWQLWDREQMTWHDRLSGTRLRYYPKPE
jgi:uncharacterized RDD family membrane protein YckC